MALWMSDHFARQITDHQQRLYGYIYSLVGRSSASWDVLQETNLVLWRKQAEFQPGSNFEAWAFTVARFQVLAFLRDRKREPLSILTPELVESFAMDAQTEAGQFTRRLAALQRCREQLGAKARRMIRLYYDDGLSVKEVATQLGQSANAVKQALFRVRRTLQDCIELTIPASPK